MPISVRTGDSLPGTGAKSNGSECYTVFHAFNKTATVHEIPLPRAQSETHPRNVQCRCQLPRLLVQDQISPEELVSNAVQ